MKVFIVLAAFVVAASAGNARYGGFGNGGPVISNGASTQFRSDDSYGNYNFGYDESHATGSTSRREEETNGVRRGSYSLTDADGRQRTVDYIADQNGFRATIRTNEPGVEAKDPADVLINKDGQSTLISAPRFRYNAPRQAPIPAPVAVRYGEAIEEHNEHTPPFSYSFGLIHTPHQVPSPLPIYQRVEAY